MNAKKIKIASLIITHDKVKEVKAQMDIIRELWEPMLGNIDIYHEFNGEKGWYLKKYKEDYLHIHKSMAHLAGANYMFNQGIKHILQSGKKYDFIIASSGDTWFYDAKKLKSIILTCQRKDYQIASSLWGFATLGTEFFIIRPELAEKIFPLKFPQIINKYNPLRTYRTKIAIFESIFTLKIIRILKSPSKIYLIPGRKTVWPKNRFYSANFYASHHDPQKRRKDIGIELRSLLGEKIENMPVLNTFLS